MVIWSVVMAANATKVKSKRPAFFVWAGLEGGVRQMSTFCDVQKGIDCLINCFSTQHLM